MKKFLLENIFSDSSAFLTATNKSAAPCGTPNNIIPIMKIKNCVFVSIATIYC